MVLQVLKELKVNILIFLLGVYDNVRGLVLTYKNKCELEKRSGDVAVITGGARGIGASVVEQLLKCDYHVIIGCRNTSAGASLVRKLREGGVKSGSTTVLQLDMASLDSIFTFSKAVLQTRPKINVLINNAGIMAVPYKETEDGYESTWGVNYLGHFWLTHLLLQRMHENPSPTRIVNVSSCAHILAKNIDFSDVNMTKEYISNSAYTQSKLAQLLFTKYLNQRLTEINSKVQVYAVHPGIVNTEIFKETIYYLLFKWLIGFILRTPEQGSRSIMYACLSKDLDKEGGAYISDCCITEPSSLVKNAALQKKLFQHSMDCLKIKYFGKIL